MPTYDELKRAFFGYYAYWGTYTINEADSSVVHSVQGSLLPGEVGLNYKRFLSIEGTKLVVTTPTFKAAVALAFCRDVLDSAQIRDDEEFTNRLTFERSPVSSWLIVLPDAVAHLLANGRAGSQARFACPGTD